MTAPAMSDLERQRRLSGLGFAELARRTGIPYMRLYRFFNGGSPLSEEEETGVRGVLREATAPESEAAS